MNGVPFVQAVGREDCVAVADDEGTYLADCAPIDHEQFRTIPGRSCKDLLDEIDHRPVESSASRIPRSILPKIEQSLPMSILQPSCCAKRLGKRPCLEYAPRDATAREP